VKDGARWVLAAFAANTLTLAISLQLGLRTKIVPVRVGVTVKVTLPVWPVINWSRDLTGWIGSGAENVSLVRPSAGRDDPVHARDCVR
jgi:hypothetical protein